MGCVWFAAQREIRSHLNPGRESGKVSRPTSRIQCEIPGPAMRIALRRNSLTNILAALPQEHGRNPNKQRTGPNMSMFSKSRTEPSVGHTQHGREEEPLYQPPNETGENSLIGSGLHVSGTINTEGNLHVDGVVDGQIRANVLTVGTDASVQADIVASDIVVSGTVVGSIRSDKVRLSNTANVRGEIYHRLFAIESGAQFEGTVHHSKDPLVIGNDQDPEWESETSEEQDAGGEEQVAEDAGAPKSEGW